MRRQIEEPATPPYERNASLPKALSDAVLQGLNKDPAKRPQTASTLASLIRSGSEAEFGVMRQAKDAFNSNTSYFLPSWALCFSPVMLVVLLAVLFAPLAGKARILPQFAVGFWAIELLAILSCLQLYKAAATILLSEAASSKSFRPATKRVAMRLFRGLPEFLSTQAASLVDLRLSSFRDNLLWPVVWAQEGLSGRAALAHSRELCRTVPAASLTMAPRQYSPALVAVLLYPLMFASLSGASIVVWGTAIFSSGAIWLGLFSQPLIALAVYSRYGVAFPFLYWFAHVCRGEGTMPSLPAAGLRPESKRNPNRQPVVLFWWLLPLVMTAVIFLSPHLRNRTTNFQEAMSEGRATAILKEIDGGVNVNASDLNGWTPLQAAARRGDAHLAEALLKRGADVDAHGNSKATPLITAAEYNRKDLAAMFLSHGANVTAVDEDGRSALIMAALRGNQEIVSMLLEHGANPSTKDNDGKTALDYAREEGYEDLVALLTR
jgi:ankyrin repeat protein